MRGVRGRIRRVRRGWWSRGGENMERGWWKVGMFRRGWGGGWEKGYGGVKGR